MWGALDFSESKGSLFGIFKGVLNSVWTFCISPIMFLKPRLFRRNRDLGVNEIFEESEFPVINFIYEEFEIFFSISLSVFCLYILRGCALDVFL